MWSSVNALPCNHNVLVQLKAARLEIRDLQAEFEVERNDYLAVIRRLEREGQLLHSLLERMVPLVRRDCNYSNLDRLKKEAVWDEESGVWKLPDVMMQKTTLPSGVTRGHRERLKVCFTDSSLKCLPLFFLLQQYLQNFQLAEAQLLIVGTH